MSKRDQIIGAGPRHLARRHAVRLRPRLTGADDLVVTFADGDVTAYDTVLWATGYTNDNTWIDIAGVTDGGRIRQSRGVTPSPGLYTLGLGWQHTRGSALLGWVGDDAAFLAQQIQAVTT
jgi:putative flavoprotein involved in K+ transport